MTSLLSEIPSSTSKKISVIGVIKDAILVYYNNLFIVIGVTAPFILLYISCFFFFYGEIPISGGLYSYGNHEIHVSLLMVVFSLVIFILSLLTTGILTCGSVYGLVRGRFPLKAAWRLTCRRSWLLLATYFVSLVAFILGLVVLIVPGIVIALRYWVAIPVALIERKGPLAALGRSVELTRGNRWRLLGVLSIVLLLNLVFDLLTVGLDRGAGFPGALIGSLASEFIVMPITVLSVAAAYVRLRAAHGDNEDDLDSAFPDVIPPTGIDASLPRVSEP